MTDNLWQEKGGMDSRTAVYCLEAETLHGAIRKVQRHLDLNDASRETSPEYRENLHQYRGSGRWRLYRTDDKAIGLYVDVGCWCSHDCCGHLCGLSATIWRKRPGEWFVEVYRAFNY